jgi:hypothetical protein
MFSGESGVTIDRDGDGVLKSSDLFYDMVDSSMLLIPQADEQQKLFAKMILDMLDGNLLMPRLWYFPYGSVSVALLTGDHHGQNWNREIETVADVIEMAGGRYSLFVYPDMIDSALVQDLVRRGHTVAPHVYYPRPSNRLMRARLYAARWFSSRYLFAPRLADLAEECAFGVSEFEKLGVGSVPVTRTHYLIWLGWTETAQLLEQHGFQMDFSFTGLNPRPRRRALPGDEEGNAPSGLGYVNGSGLPMRFMTREGRLVDMFEQCTVFEDDAVAREMMPDVPDDLTTLSRMIEASNGLIERSVTGYHSALVWNLHPEHITKRWPPQAPTTLPLIKAIAARLQHHKIPMLGASEWLNFVQARYRTQIDSIRYDGRSGRGGFVVYSERAVAGLTILLPLQDPRTILNEVHLSPEIPFALRRQTLNGIDGVLLQLDLPEDRRVRVEYSLGRFPR